MGIGINEYVKKKSRFESKTELFVWDDLLSSVNKEAKMFADEQWLFETDITASRTVARKLIIPK